jgi:sec-independent protein translocase protein TatC
MSNGDLKLPLGTHLELLRSLLLRCLLLILCVTLISFYFSDTLIQKLTTYAEADAPSGLIKERLQHFKWTNTHTEPQSFTWNGSSHTLAPGTSVVLQQKSPSFLLLSPVEGFKSCFKLSLYFSFTLCLPALLVWIQGFIWPALYLKEQRLVWPLVALCLVLTFTGICFGLFVSLPLSNHFFQHFNSTLGQDWWSLSLYLEYMVWLCLASGLSFGFLSLLIAGVHYEILSVRLLRKSRRAVALGVLVIAAILTPPDVFTQLLVAAPLLALFELSILYGRWRERRKARV